MDIYNRIKELANTQKISINRLEENLGFARGYLYSWKKKTPGVDKLQKVADYFQVSTDYLLGRADNMNKQGKSDKYNHDLKEFIESNMDGMAYGGENLTEDDKQKLEMALKLVFDKYNDKF
ncbi:helix-turn-helix domain-containing protein [Latilactobacillus sakei]